ncbi:hypothetical protein EMIHUDRAFT_242499, partial [Emiliania huxleyi CCMP1516]|uniref:Uncharacterized protein n=2 Tax=Emiliania huxleyi TaxID=2903 RepID=A0A0D3J8P1_EMIH1
MNSSKDWRRYIISHYATSPIPRHGPPFAFLLYHNSGFTRHAIFTPYAGYVAVVYATWIGVCGGAFTTEALYRRRCAMAGIMSAGSAEGDFSPVPRAVITGNAESISAARYSDAQRDVAFSIATAGGFEVPMRALESQGADPNARTEGGDTAVMWAAQGCQLQSLTILHELGANLDAQNDIGWHAVVWAGSNAPGMSGLGLEVRSRLTHMSPVMWLVPAAFVPGIRALVVDHGVDINAANALGLTALMFAVAAEKLELLGELKALGRKGSLDKLAELGADLDATDDNGKSARALLEAAAGTTTGLDDHGEALSPSRVLEVMWRAPTCAATYLYRLESCSAGEWLAGRAALLAGLTFRAGPDPDGFQAAIVGIGNDAGDLDSLAASIAIADWQPVGGCGGRPLWVPIAPFPRSDFRLRQDACLLFNHIGFSFDGAGAPEALLHLDDVDAATARRWSDAGGLGLALVDHNACVPGVRSLLGDRVVAI